MQIVISFANRNFIGIEMNEEWFSFAKNRLENAKNRLENKDNVVG